MRFYDKVIISGCLYPPTEEGIAMCCRLFKIDTVVFSHRESLIYYCTTTRRSLVVSKILAGIWRSFCIRHPSFESLQHHATT